jgi:hypothetical protein
MNIDENVLDILLSVVPYGWKTAVDSDGKFYAGFISTYGILKFELTGGHWCKVSTPVVPRVPDNVFEPTQDIMDLIARKNLRYPSCEDINTINRLLERDLLSIYDDETDVVRYLLFYRD